MSNWFKFKTTTPDFNDGVVWIRADAITSVKDRIKGDEAFVTADGAQHIVDCSAERIFKQLHTLEHRLGIGVAPHYLIEFPGTYDIPKPKEEVGKDE